MLRDFHEQMRACTTPFQHTAFQLKEQYADFHTSYTLSHRSGCTLVR